MGRRRTARERALRSLFALEFNDAPAGGLVPEPGRKAGPRTAEAYAVRLVEGVRARRAEIDALIEGTSRNWRVERMAVVDRNILRIAVFEMLEDAFIPPAVVINEALEVAKRFSGEASAVFINGVLDAVRRKIRPDESSLGRQDENERAKK
ncbi:MAG: transcription antitermination factor NusB [Candidatus Aminicenantes bacterium]|nr:transcription antitermination factor NusB [Candidatus Aminicenantes bacterium]